MLTTMSSLKNVKLRKAPVWILSLFLLAACTKDRPDKIADGPDRDEPALARALFANPVDVTVGNETDTRAAAVSANALLATGGVAPYKVVSHNAPGAIAFMFKELALQVAPNKSYKIVFSLNETRGLINAYVESPNKADFPRLLTEGANPIAQEVPGTTPGTSVWRAPAFEYEVKSYGSMVRSRNDLEEETNVLRFATSSDWENSSHLQVESQSPVVRVAGGTVAPEDQEQIERTYWTERDANASPDDINGLYTSSADLSARLGVSLVGLDTDADGPVNLYTLIEGTTLKIFQVTTSNNRILRDFDRLNVEQGRFSDALRDCPAESRTKVTLEGNERCVHIFLYSVTVKYVNPERVPNDEFGGDHTQIRFQALRPGERSEFVQIERDALPIEAYTNPQINIALDHRNYFKATYLRDQTYVMRRMISDVSNSFSSFFVTETGPIQLVKFVFKSNKVDIVRATPTIQGDTNTPTDNEVLLSVRAQYYRTVRTDVNGNPVDFDRLVEANFTDAGEDVYVRLDWGSMSGLSQTASPLENYAWGTSNCFSQREWSIYSVQNRLEPVQRGEGVTEGPVVKGDFSFSTEVGSSRVDLQACKLEYSIVSPK